MPFKTLQMSDRTKYKYSIAGQPLYPHIKLTRETFPRLLSTRIIDDDGAEYFGAFLTRSAARILIDFLNTTFRLRSCTIPVDGRFPIPCTQYYERRCVAPCVESLCSPVEYQDFVELARLFLRNDRKEFEISVLALIDASAGRTDFERAASFRDVLTKVREFWSNKRLQVWLDDAVDTYVAEADGDDLRIFVVTTRRARTLGSRVFTFHFLEDGDYSDLLADIILQFYRAHLPREIRVPFDFKRRREVSQELSRRFGRSVRIIVEGMVPERAAALKALARTKLDIGLENLKPVVTAKDLKRKLMKMFGLNRPPSRIEAYDAAHISGSFATAGMSVWQEGRLVSEEYRKELSEQTTEIAALRGFVSKRFSIPAEPLPELILVDGGKAHVNAVLIELSAKLANAIPVIGAVKPRGKHGDISHFLTADGHRVEFDPASPAMRVLKLLRDEAHELANAAHGQSRDMSHFYELAAILPSLNEKERQRLLTRFGSIRKILNSDSKKITEAVGAERAATVVQDLEIYRSEPGKKPLPLIVPIRYDDPNGMAGDLRPIKTSNRPRR